MNIKRLMQQFCEVKLSILLMNQFCEAKLSTH